MLDTYFLTSWLIKKCSRRVIQPITASQHPSTKPDWYADMNRAVFNFPGFATTFVPCDLEICPVTIPMLHALSSAWRHAQKNVNNHLSDDEGNIVTDARFT